MNEEELREIEARWLQATKGTWDYSGYRVFDENGEWIADCLQELDAEAIANAPNDIPNLIAEIRRLRAVDDAAKALYLAVDDGRADHIEEAMKVLWEVAR